MVDYLSPVGNLLVYKMLKKNYSKEIISIVVSFIMEDDEAITAMIEWIEEKNPTERDLIEAIFKIHHLLKKN